MEVSRALQFRKAVCEVILQALVEHEKMDPARWSDLDGAAKFAGMLFGLTDAVDMLLAASPSELHLSHALVEWLGKITAEQLLRGLEIYRKLFEEGGRNSNDAN